MACTRRGPRTMPTPVVTSVYLQARARSCPANFAPRPMPGGPTENPENGMTGPVESFAPSSRADARVLILGSMPGEASLHAHEYYAHVRNRFWPFMGELVGAMPAMPYDRRLSRLHEAGIALWDVLRQCERSGSLDSAIVGGTARPNDFIAFLGRHPRVRWVLFNGARAESDFLRFGAPLIGRFGLSCRRLPSTSPANAAQRVEYKLQQWRDGLHAAGVLDGDA
jgi:double-stranded uracil-DNA glycosylase